MAARIALPAPLILLGIALALGACKGPGAAGGAERASRKTPSEPVASALPGAGASTPAPQIVAVPVVPAPLPGGTSDRGDRRARPTPIGQIAPEEAPVAPSGGAPAPR